MSKVAAQCTTLPPSAAGPDTSDVMYTLLYRLKTKLKKTDLRSSLLGVKHLLSREPPGLTLQLSLRNVAVAYALYSLLRMY